MLRSSVGGHEHTLTVGVEHNVQRVKPRSYSVSVAAAARPQFDIKAVARRAAALIRWAFVGQNASSHKSSDQQQQRV